MDIGRERPTMNVALWIIQGLLAALFLLAGGAKLIMSADQMAGPVALPVWFLRFIGVAEVLGALGLVLPGPLRVRPLLTPLAAAGAVIIMVSTAGVMSERGTVSVALVQLLSSLRPPFIAFC